MKKILIASLFFPCAVFGQIGTQVSTDNFNRANGFPLSGNWSDEGFNGNSFGISSSAVTVNNLASDDNSIWNPWASGNDQYSQAEITASGTGAGSGFGVCVRHSSTPSTQTLYRCEMDGAGNIALDKFVATAFTSLASRSVSYVAGTKLGLAITGNTLTIWYGGVQQGASVTDSTSPITTGLPGISYSSTLSSGTIDNWDAGTTGVTAATTTLPNTQWFFLP